MTGNKLVDEISQMNINSIPEAWYMNLRKGTTPHALAILILWDILYWYKWTEVRNETTGLVTGHKKKFSDKDWLQRSNEQLGNKFGISKKVAREALDFLEGLGLIKREYKALRTNMGTIPHVMYIAVCPEMIRKYSFQILGKESEDEQYTENKEMPDRENENSQEGSEQMPNREFKRCPTGHEAHDQPGSTYTTTTTDNSTSTTTNSFSAGKPAVRKKPKKPPLIEREPENQYEEVEKIYLLNYRSLYERGIMKTKEPLIKYDQVRGLEKKLFEQLDVELIKSAVSKSVNDSWCVNGGYSLATILSVNVINRLINENEHQGNRQTKQLPAMQRQDHENIDIRF